MSRTGTILLVAYVLLIFTISTRPDLRPPGPNFTNKDKVAHLVEYGILGVLLFRAFGSGLPGSRWTILLFLLAVGASVAASDEMVQGTVPGRSKDVLDWAADVVGLAIGISLAMRVGASRPTRNAGEAGGAP
jgi:VanZ family protein